MDVVGWLTTPVEQHVVELINERLSSWEQTLSGAIDYFTEIVRCEEMVGRAHQKLAAQLARSVSSLSGSPSGSSSPRSLPENNWLGPLQSISLQTASGSESLGRYGGEETLKQVSALRQEYRESAKGIREGMQRVQRGLGREQEGLQKAMREHERVWRERLAGSSSTDVWVSETGLRRQISSYLVAKQEYCQTLTKLYTETRVLNATCARSLSSTLSEHFTVAGKLRAAQAEQLHDVARGCRADEDGEGEWRGRVGRMRLDYEWRLEAPPADGMTLSLLHQISCKIAEDQLPNVASASISVRPVQVVKSGLVMRPGGTFGPAWIPHLALLTDTHHLHLYTLPKLKDTIKSGKQLAEKSDEAYATLFGSSTSTSSPSLSIHVAGASVAVDDGSAGYCWTLLPSDTTSPPSSSSVFGRSAERKHVFRSLLEEDMVDWCIAIKEANTLQADTRDEIEGSPEYEHQGDFGLEPFAAAQEDYEVDDLKSPLSASVKMAVDDETSPSSPPPFALDNPWG